MNVPVVVVAYPKHAAFARQVLAQSTGEEILLGRMSSPVALRNLPFSLAKVSVQITPAPEVVIVLMVCAGELVIVIWVDDLMYAVVVVATVTIVVVVDGSASALVVVVGAMH